MVNLKEGQICEGISAANATKIALSHDLNDFTRLFQLFSTLRSFLQFSNTSPTRSKVGSASTPSSCQVDMLRIEQLSWAGSWCRPTIAPENGRHLAEAFADDLSAALARARWECDRQGLPCYPAPPRVRMSLLYCNSMVFSQKSPDLMFFCHSIASRTYVRTPAESGSGPKLLSFPA